MTSQKQSQPVRNAFARRTRHTGLLVLLFATTLFAVFSNGLLEKARTSNLRKAAKLLSASLPLEPPQAFKRAVARAVRRNDDLIAVATLDAFGKVSSVFPDRLQHRHALDVLLKQDGKATRITCPTDGASRMLSAVAVPFGNSLSPENAKLVAVMRVDSPAEQWLTAVAMFIVLVAAVAWYASGNLNGWFDRQLLEPLRGLADIMANPQSDAKRLDTARFTRWNETAKLARRFKDLRETLDAINLRAKRIRKDAQQTMRERQAGFDRQLQRAHFFAQTDPLTQLRNRAFLDENLEAIFEAQQGTRQALSAVMIDLDNFKTFNDTLGHQIGDALLKFTGTLLNGSIRPNDYAIRYGGDEFLLLLPEADAEQAMAIAERIVKMFGQHTKMSAARMDAFRGGEMVTMSAGVASIPQRPYESGRKLIAAADRALYFAKRSGKSKVEIADFNALENLVTNRPGH